MTSRLALRLVSGHDFLSRFSEISKSSNFYRQYLAKKNGIELINEHIFDDDRIIISESFPVEMEVGFWHSELKSYLISKTGKEVVAEISENADFASVKSEYGIENDVECAAWIISLSILDKSIYPANERIAEYRLARLKGS